MKIPLKTVYQHKLVRSVAVVAGGTVVAQVVTVASSPFITRMYGPEAFGILGVFVSITAVLSPLATLSYNHAIALPKSDYDARVLVRLSLLLAVSVGMLAALVVLLLRDGIAGVLGFDARTGLLWLIPILVVFDGAEQTFTQWLIRTKRFKGMSAVAVGQATGVSAATIGVGSVSPTAPALILIATIGHVLHAALLRIVGGRTMKIPYGQPAVHHSDLRRIAKDYRDFPQFRAPAILLNKLSQNLPVVLLSAFFSPAIAGFYALTRRVLGLPAILIAQSVSKVILPHLAEAAHAGQNLKRTVIKSTFALVAAGFMPFGIVIAFGPSLFALVFGPEWYVAGEYARWLSVWLYPAFTNRPSVQAIPLLGLQGYFLVYEVVLIGARTIAIIIGASVFASAHIAIALFSIVGLVLNIMLIVGVTYAAAHKRRETLSQEAVPS